MVFWWASVLKGDATATREKRRIYFGQRFARDKEITSPYVTIRSLARNAHDLLVGHCLKGGRHRDPRKTIHVFLAKIAEDQMDQRYKRKRYCNPWKPFDLQTSSNISRLAWACKSLHLRPY